MSYRGAQIAVIVGTIIGAGVLSFGLTALFALPTMWLWNGVVPPLTQGALSVIGFWQAWGLLLLTRILFANNGAVQVQAQK